MENINWKRGDTFKYFGTIDDPVEGFDLSLWTVESAIKGPGIFDMLTVTVTGDETYIIELPGGTEHWPINAQLRWDVKFTSPDALTTRTWTVYINVIEEITP